MASLRQLFAPNGKRIVASLETMQGEAEINGFHDDGTPDYEGTTEVWWDSQRTVTQDHGAGPKAIFIDEDGGEWTFDQCTLTEDAS